MGRPRAVFVAAGTRGDVLPLVAVARQLQRAFAIDVDLCAPSAVLVELEGGWQHSPFRASSRETN